MFLTPEMIVLALVFHFFASAAHFSSQNMPKNTVISFYRPMISIYFLKALRFQFTISIYRPTISIYHAAIHDFNLPGIYLTMPADSDGKLKSHTQTVN